MSKGITQYLNAGKFFKKYAPGVKNYYHKQRGKNGMGKPLTFSVDDLSHISAGIAKMKYDIDQEIYRKVNNQLPKR